MLGFTKKERSWILYDVGNSAFYTTIMAGFFPVFFKNYWAGSVEATTSSFYLGITNSVAAAIVAILAPLIGVIVDVRGGKKKFLFTFTLIGIVASGLLAVTPQNAYLMAMIVFGIGMVGVATGMAVYDSQLVEVTSKEKFHKVSAAGFSFGYLGGGLLFAANVAMTLKPEMFGLRDASEAVKISFVSVAVWWLIFSIPIFKNVPDTEPTSKGSSKDALKLLVKTLKEITSNRNVLLFLAAYWLYIDGVGTIMRMAVDYGMSLGFESKDLITALLIVQFVGFPAAIVFGKIGEKLGAKFGILLGVIIYSAITVYAYFMKNSTDFYVLAVLVALVQGGVQSLSRSLFAHFVPANKSTEYFGVFNMLGKFAAIIGPVLMGLVGYLTESTRTSMLSVLVLFAAGGLLLTKVSTQETSSP